MNAEMNAKNTVEGYFRMVAVDAVTGKERLLADWFPNIITDIGLNAMATNDFLAAFYVGTGSTPPANSDAQMGNGIAYSLNTQVNSFGAVQTGTVYFWRRITKRFAQGAASGNLTEVGTGWGATVSGNGTLFSRTLIKDGNGNPVTIVVLPREFLDVTYEFRVYPPATDATFSVTISGVTHNCVIKPAYFAQWAVGQIYFLNSGYHYVYTGTLGTISGGPSGTGATYGVPTNVTYSNNSLVRDGTANFGLTDGNLSGGIRSITFECGGGGKWQCQFDPPIDKTSSKLLTLNLRVSWARR